MLLRKQNSVFVIFYFYLLLFSGFYNLERINYTSQCNYKHLLLLWSDFLFYEVVFNTNDLTYYLVLMNVQYQNYHHFEDWNTKVKHPNKQHAIELSVYNQAIL